MGLFGIGSSEVLGLVKKVITGILRWVWDKIKDWVIRNWQTVVIGIMVLVIVILVKLLLLKLQIAPVLRNFGLLSA